MMTLPVRGRFGLVVLLAVPVVAAAQAPRSADVVKATVKANKPDAEGKQTVTITLTVKKPYHLYANPVGNDLLKSVQTTVKFTSKVSDVKIDYPAGTVVKNKDVGDWKMYEGKVVIKATVRRTKGDTAPLQLTIRLQAKNDYCCMLPSILKLTAE